MGNLLEEEEVKQPSRVWALILGLVVTWGIAHADVAATPAAPAAPAATAAAPAAQQPAAVSAPAAPEMDLIDQITQPVWWFNWGFDTRLREEYQKNNNDLSRSSNDTKNVIRWRTRLWGEFGPFFKDDSLGVPNGLTTYIRGLYEPRYYQEGTHGVANTRQWNEVVLDNLYVNWERMAGLPFAIRVGRQDIVYGRGWVMCDGTPADGGRTIYDDAVKATLYFDAATKVDLFVIDNKANPRVDPINDEHRLTSEYNAQLFGAYLISNYFKPREVNLYYIYKNEEKALNSSKIPGDRTVHTVGALSQGKFTNDSRFDYYLEAAGQWGREQGSDSAAWGLNSDLGYTFDAAWQPRLRAFYEFLSGDNPATKQYEGWDPILGRWPQWSEIFANRYKSEGGLAANYSNLRRMGTGIKFLPTKRMTLMFDYSYLLANHHQFGTTGNFGDGLNRGNLFTGKLFYKFTDRLSGHLWAEFLKPGNYYSSKAQDACFLRWEITYEFKPIVRR